MSRGTGNTPAQGPGCFSFSGPFQPPRLSACTRRGSWLRDGAWPADLRPATQKPIHPVTGTAATTATAAKGMAAGDTRTKTDARTVKVPAAIPDTRADMLRRRVTSAAAAKPDATAAATANTDTAGNPLAPVNTAPAAKHAATKVLSPGDIPRISLFGMNPPFFGASAPQKNPGTSTWPQQQTLINNSDHC